MTGRSPTDVVADRVAAALARAGTDRAFGVPGGGANLALIEAMGRHGIDFTLAHGETAACIMASTYGHLTGRPAAAMVTRGPGVASAVNGVAQATLDRQPLILVSDTVPAATADRIAHQRLAQRQLLAPVTRASATVGRNIDPAALDRLTAASLGPPPGAVHLDLDPGTVSEVPESGPPSDPSPTEAVEAAARAVARSRHPVVIVGLGAGGEPDRLAGALERFGAPVLTTYQGVGALPTDHPLAAGLFTNGASEAPLLDRADLLVTIGLDPVEPIPAPWRFRMPIVSLATHPTTDPYLPIDREVLGPPAALAERVLASDHGWGPDDGATHRRAVQAALAGEARASTPPASTADEPTRQAIGPVELVQRLAAAAPERLVTTVDAGAHFLAIMPFWPARRPGDLLISNGLATMGYALPAAIGASLARPDQPVWCLVGDGGLGMAVAELETVARLRLPVTVVVFDDAALSLIRIKQGPAGGGGAGAVAYGDVDFAALARSVGLAASTATNGAELDRALAEAGEGHQLIDVRIDPGSYPHLLRVTRG